MNIINGYIEFVSPNTSPRTLNYVACIDIDRVLLSLSNIPKEYLGASGHFSAGYYPKPYESTGSGSGSATLNHFLKAPEIVEYLTQSPKFVNYCIANNITWFFKGSYTDKISECTSKHALLGVSTVDALKDFK